MADTSEAREPEAGVAAALQARALAFGQTGEECNPVEVTSSPQRLKQAFKLQANTFKSESVSRNARVVRHHVNAAIALRLREL